MDLKRIKCAVAGGIAGACNGLFGAGGGMLLVPIFTRIVKLEEKHAYASAVAVIFPLSAVSALVYFLRLQPPMLSALPYLAGGLIGGWFGGRVFEKIPTVFLRRAFSLLLIFGGVRSLL